jgi:hypothetical protein
MLAVYGPCRHVLALEARSFALTGGMRTVSSSGTLACAQGERSLCSTRCCRCFWLLGMQQDFCARCTEAGALVRSAAERAAAAIVGEASATGLAGGGGLCVASALVSEELLWVALLLKVHCPDPPHQ